jgi:hypothetical protein
MLRGWRDAVIDPQGMIQTQFSKEDSRGVRAFIRPMSLVTSDFGKEEDHEGQDL